MCDEIYEKQLRHYFYYVILRINTEHQIVFGLSLAVRYAYFRFHCSITIIYTCVYIYIYIHTHVFFLCIIFVYVYVYICIIYIIYYKYTMCIRVCVRVLTFFLSLYYKCKILTCMYLRSRDLNRTHCWPLRNLRVSYMPRERKRGTRGRSVDKKEKSLFWFCTRAFSNNVRVHVRSRHAPIPKNRFVQECYIKFYREKEKVDDVSD